ncbi:MAG: tyrosine recombinase [Tissierellia bacterium]|nr:tyrosine recombinase [Tissierellia bacterium]
MEKTIEEYLEYLELELNYSNYTITSYQSDLFDFALFLKNNKINYLKLDKNIIRKYLKKLDEEKLKNKSIARKLSALRMFYNYLLEFKIIDCNILNSISNPKVEKKLPNYLNYQEINDLLEGFDNSIYGIRNRLILEMLYSTGLRLSEISNVKLNDINQKDKIIKVMGKGAKERIVYYGKYAEKFLNLYLGEARQIFLNSKSNEYLFINKFGNKLSKSSIEKIVKESTKQISLKHNISPHTLRHTFATHLLNNGADIKTVQELLGHSSLKATEIYTHVTNERIKEVYLHTHPRKERKDEQ